MVRPIISDKTVAPRAIKIKNKRRIGTVSSQLQIAVLRVNAQMARKIVGGSLLEFVLAADLEIGQTSGGVRAAWQRSLVDRLSSENISEFRARPIGRRRPYALLVLIVAVRAAS